MLEILQNQALQGPGEAAVALEVAGHTRLRSKTVINVPQGGDLLEIKQLANIRGKRGQRDESTVIKETFISRGQGQEKECTVIVRFMR